MGNAASDNTPVRPSKIVWVYRSATNTLRAHIDGNTSSRPFATVVAVFKGPGQGVLAYRARVFVSGPPHCLNLGDFPTKSKARAAVNAVLPLYYFTE
jgi:hypothetical protein